MRSLALLGSAVLLASLSAAGEKLDGIAAVIEERVILLSELDEVSGRMIRRIQQERGSLSPKLVQQIRKEALEGLISDLLIQDFAKQRNLTATPEELDNAILGIARDEGVTVEEIYAAAERQGMAHEAYRVALSSQITRMKVISGAVRSRVSVSEEEVQEVFERRYARLEPGMRVRVRHLLLAWPKGVDANGRGELRERAVEIRAAALQNGGFAMAVRRHSSLPSAAAGGIAVFRDGDLSAEIAEQVFGLETGAISEPIETEHGLNLFQLVERFDPSEVRIEDVQDALRAELIERKTRPEFDRWMAELRASRYIGIILPELR